jgi:hypothetical protein
LQNASVLTVAVSSLAKFGALCKDLLRIILVFLARIEMDMDDEVKYRATYYFTFFESYATHSFDIRSVPMSFVHMNVDERQKASAPKGLLVFFNEMPEATASRAAIFHFFIRVCV